ncbi:MAG: DNA polymerase III subunit beta [Firmicutes bacterium]|nr:DNA polymerase III subunit beta [Bacillota bacterium]
MKIVIDGSDLAEAVGVVSRASGAKQINPVLEGIKLTAKEGKVVASATDLDIYLKKTVKADIKQSGEVIVPRVFVDYVRKLEKSQVSITAEGDTIVVKHGDNVFNFQGFAKEEYPDIVSLKADPHFSIKADALKDIISKTTICASTDDSRPVLRGILFEIDGAELTAVALDGFRLARVTKVISNHKDKTSIIVPAKSLVEISKLLADENGEVNLVVENKFLQVSIGNTVFASRLIEGEFINYGQIIPKSFSSDIVVETSAFAHAVERAGLLVRSDRINLITLKIVDKKIQINSTNEIGKINELVAASLTGKDLTISFNAKYLFDALRNIDDSFIKLSLTGEHSPATITASKDGDYLFLILPVRMS